MWLAATTLNSTDIELCFREHTSTNATAIPTAGKTVRSWQACGRRVKPAGELLALLREQKVVTKSY